MIVLLVACLAVTGCRSTQSLIHLNSTDGWDSLNGGQWEVNGFELYGTKDAAIDKHCILVSKESYRDFICTVEYQAIHGDSGFYFRLQPADNAVGFKGYHAEIRSDGTNAGGIFDVAVGWLTKPDPALTAAAFRPGTWNTMSITAIGDGIKVSLNGHIMSHITGKRTDSGKFGIQLHANEATQVKFRKITVTEIEKLK
jgi:hypothetical protein